MRAVKSPRPVPAASSAAGDSGIGNSFFAGPGFAVLPVISRPHLNTSLIKGSIPFHVIRTPMHRSTKAITRKTPCTVCGEMRSRIFAA